MKRCNKCGIGLVVGENWYNSHAKVGSFICKKCSNELSKKWQKKNPEKAMKINMRWYYNSVAKKPEKHAYQSYKRSAKERNLEFHLTYEQFVEKFWGKVCFYCGANSSGIDRLDSSKGYIYGNMVTCCTQCNYMKRDYTKEEFINQCIRIAARNKEG